MISIRYLPNSTLSASLARLSGIRLIPVTPFFA
jgi:hypothetical protein